MMSLADIDTFPRPALAIDVVRAQIIAANSGGRAWLGISADTCLPVTLDDAMPALAKLRQLLRTRQASSTPQALAFWHNGRSLTVTCDIAFSKERNALAILSGQNGQTAPGERPAAVPTPALPPPRQSTGTETNPAKPTGGGETELAPALPPAEPLRIERSDSDTLKEIARRIREGRHAHQPKPTPATAPVTTASSASTPRPAPSAPASEAAPPTVNLDAIAAQPSTPAAQAPGPSAATAAADQPPHLKSEIAIPAAADLARLAHELKTPLTAIASAAEIMRDERLGPMQNERYLEYAADVHESAQHALAVISRMLTPGQANERLTDAFERIDLNSLVKRTVSMVLPLAEDRGISLTIEADGGTPAITANATALRQIILNLLTNALKFTPRDGDVRAITGYLDNGTPFLVIRDSGSGIDPAIIAEALEKTGNHTPAQRAGGGFGIGLPLVLRLVQEIGGRIEFDSAPGKGTVALLTFRA
jgi:two-component system, cell cycle sensor histidine kinase PleC